MICPTSSSSEPCIPTFVHCRSCFLSQCPASPSLRGILSPAPSLFCSMGCLKVLRDPFLVCGPVNKTVQYFGIFSLCLGEGGGFLAGNPLELRSDEQNRGGSWKFHRILCTFNYTPLKDWEGGKKLSGFVLRLLLCILFNGKIRK